MPDDTLHRFWMTITNERDWYQIMRECRREFGDQWRTMPRTRRKLRRRLQNEPPVSVWFEVPDSKFETWLTLRFPPK